MFTKNTVGTQNPTLQNITICFMSNEAILSRIQVFWTQPAGGKAGTGWRTVGGNLALKATASSQVRKGPTVLNPVVIATRSHATATLRSVACARLARRNVRIIDDAGTRSMDPTGGNCLAVGGLILAVISQVCEPMTVIGDVRQASNRMHLAQVHPCAHVTSVAPETPARETDSGHQKKMPARTPSPFSGSLLGIFVCAISRSFSQRLMSMASPFY